MTTAYPSKKTTRRAKVIMSLVVLVLGFGSLCFSLEGDEGIVKTFEHMFSIDSGLSSILVVSALISLLFSMNFFWLLGLKDKWQIRVICTELLLLFLVFFYSFELSLPFMLDKLPYLISKGVTTTVYVSLMSIALAFVLALCGALAKLSGKGMFVGVASFYTSFFRGVPLLVQLFLIYLGLPQIGFIVDPIPAGVVALGLCYGAYMTEIFRSGIQAIQKGQWEAAAALGLSQFRAFQKVIFPQAFRLIVPPTSNSFIAMLKDSSLVSVVGVWDLMYVARAQGRSDFRTLEMLISAALIYWILSIMFELIQSKIERHYGKSDRV
jgi:polar amino acid transport system permease protein